jgi:hypothetical protein
MKKTMVIAATLFLISCGGSSDSPATIDSTVVDSIKIDSVVISADSVAVADSSISVTQGGGGISEGKGETSQEKPVK